MSWVDEWGRNDDAVCPECLLLLSIAALGFLSVWLFLTVGAKRASFIRMNRNRHQQRHETADIQKPLLKSALS
jgi:hypothetical protein